MLMLYYLETDKQENYNLNDKYPKIVEHLLSKIAEWEKEMISPSWPGVMEYEEEIDGVKMRFAF